MEFLQLLGGLETGQMDIVAQSLSGYMLKVCVLDAGILYPSMKVNVKKMPKAILELEMPESCSNCPLEFSGRMEGFCAITEFVTDLYRDKRRPDCPLKINEQRSDMEQRLAKGGAAFVVACDKTGMLKYATSLVRKMFSTEEDACVLCGSYVPEGRMVCSVCEKDPFHVLRKEQDYEKG